MTFSFSLSANKIIHKIIICNESHSHLKLLAYIAMIARGATCDSTFIAVQNNDRSYLQPNLRERN